MALDSAPILILNRSYRIVFIAVNNEDQLIVAPPGEREVLFKTYFY